MSLGRLLHHRSGVAAGAPTVPLSRGDRDTLEAFLKLRAATCGRLDVKAGSGQGLQAIAVLWLDGQPVAYAHRHRGAAYARVYVGEMAADEFAAAARRYMFECSGTHAQVHDDPSSGAYTVAGDLT